jgi:hypothetical protein
VQRIKKSTFFEKESLVPSTPEYLSENEIWLERLVNLAKRLSERDLNHPMEAGWTVSAVLVHMAFWDIRIVTLLRKWQAEGLVAPSVIDSDVINEVSRHLCLAVPVHTAAEMAVTWARNANQAIAALNPALAAEIQEKAPNVRLDRAHHRQAHIEDIEKALGV